MAAAVVDGTARVRGRCSAIGCVPSSSAFSELLLADRTAGCNDAGCIITLLKLLSDKEPSRYRITVLLQIWVPIRATFVQAVPPYCWMASVLCPD